MRSTEGGPVNGPGGGIDVRKTDLDIVREAAAHQLNAWLVGTGVSVCGGGEKGPYTLVVNRLDREGLGRVLAAVLAATGGSMRPEAPDHGR